MSGRSTSLSPCRQAGGGPAPCTLPGTQQGAFVGEVRGGGDVDLLDPSAQALSVTGDGSTIPAATGQVWLMHGDVNAGSDFLPILTVQGTFESAGQAHTFSGAITIDDSRQPSATNTALPGAHPICQLAHRVGDPGRRDAGAERNVGPADRSQRALQRHEALRAARLPRWRPGRSVLHERRQQPAEHEPVQEPDSGPDPTGSSGGPPRPEAARSEGRTS